MRNWARNLTFGAAAVHAPDSVDAVRRIVADASRRGGRVRACGSLHSFNTIADTDGDLISTRALDRIVEIDRDAMTVTVEPGIRYGELGVALHEAGFALHNLPSLPHVTVGGAVATATHGSGSANGNLATAVRGIELVTADGESVSLDADDPRLAGAVVGLGALGVVVRLTLAIEPTFDIAQTVEHGLTFERGCDELAAVMASGYSVSLFTDYQGATFDQLWRKVRAGDDAAALASQFATVPFDTPVHPVSGIAPDACTEQLGVAGAWIDRLAHFRLEFTPSSGDELQTEYFVAANDGPDAVRSVRALAGELGPLLQVSEVRAIAADELWLSGSYGRDTIALHFTWIADQDAVTRFLPRLERALEPFDPRPHWGKLSTLAPDVVRHSFPRWNDFEHLVAELDPRGTFRNAYLDAILTA